ncbi:hypothetical protein A3A03_01450 [Candidatus Nomurabacteria bacterium RIFCSPLOWO2_01_FULL_40_18]|uniref:Uncharacterized protein n=1 Tax=Candidatus Nomurabacteria bacterium RIFCSPLOWO2_01_FULL_40_18 TaxID=1801773 RepID=A0A1F6XL18_9BACT|nr:MAG: hypothetical protein A3A03_01450 [Candidatus Nomurabacteria bacterium RIFCSPLOWO2_01_FULL_40_18]
MRKAYIFLILGVWLAVLPYLGFPYSGKDILTSLSGLVIILMSFVVYKESKSKEIKKEKTFENFSENKPLNEDSEEENEISQ